MAPGPLDRRWGDRYLWVAVSVTFVPVLIVAWMTGL